MVSTGSLSFYMSLPLGVSMRYLALAGQAIVLYRARMEVGSYGRMCTRTRTLGWRLCFSFIEALSRDGEGLCV